MKKIVKLHSPEELLNVADSLLSSKKNELMRAVVLESITALESYVYKIVFDVLNKKYEKNLVELLEQKTKMDFDSRISTLVSVATGKTIHKGGKLWKDYKESKKIRNNVTHSGKVVSFDEASFVLNTVYDWIAYLGANAEIELALLGLKTYMKKYKTDIFQNKNISGENFEAFISDYFSDLAPEKINLDNINNNNKIIGKADISLELGDYSVIIEAKINNKNLERTISIAKKQLNNMLRNTNFSKGVIVIYQIGEIPKYYDKVREIDDGSISIVVIQ